MVKKTGLGKGLEALLGESSLSLAIELTEPEKETINNLNKSTNASVSNAGGASGTSGASGTAGVSGISSGVNGVMELEVQQLSPGKYQPRRHIVQPELEQLAESIRSQGVIQPILVRKFGKGYEIIAGERRWRAAQIAGLSKVPVIIKEVTDRQAMIIALIENIQRSDLNPLEEARALERLAKDFGLTHAAVAEAVGKSRVTVTNILRLLVLSDEVKAFLEKGLLEVGHAKVLLALTTQEQNNVAKTIVAKKLSVRQTEQLVAGLHNRASKSSKRLPAIDPDIRRLQNSLSEKLGAVVELQHGQQGKGKIVISYNSLAELDGILDHIK